MTYTRPLSGLPFAGPRKLSMRKNDAAIAGSDRDVLLATDLQ